MEEINNNLTQDKTNKIKFEKLKEPVETTCIYCVRKNILCKFAIISSDLIDNYKDPICAECFQVVKNYNEGKIASWRDFQILKLEQFKKGCLERIDEIENKKSGLKDKFFNFFKKKSNSKLNQPREKTSIK